MHAYMLLTRCSCLFVCAFFCICRLKACLIAQKVIWKNFQMFCGLVSKIYFPSVSVKKSAVEFVKVLKHAISNMYRILLQYRPSSNYSSTYKAARGADPLRSVRTEALH